MRILKHLISLILLLTCIDATSQIIHLPRSIDGTGRTDVTGKLNSFFDLVHDGSTVVFPKGKKFRVEGILRIRNKKDLVIKGNGSAIIAETTGKDVPVPVGRPKHNWPRSREHLSIEKSERITISKLKIIGAHKSGGVHESAYVRELEAQHGVNIWRSKNITLDSMHISNVYGDCIYIGDGSAKESSDSVVVQNSFLGCTGRQGIAITHGTSIVIQGCEFSNVRRAHIDLEGNTVQSVIDHVYIKDNIFRNSRLNWISAAGKGSARNVYIIRNKLIGKDAKVMIGGNRKAQCFGPFYFISNEAERPVGNPQGVAWKIVNVAGFYAFNNKIAVQKNRGMHLIGVRNSTNVQVKNNVVSNAVGSIKNY